MRFCLTCHSFSADGLFCTQCGRSFGGRLCNSKKRHLNPPDAQFCGECGNSDLVEAASSVPMGCSTRLAIFACLGALLWWGSRYFPSLSGWSFYSLTGYHSPGIWLIEKSANLLIILFVFYFLSLLMPGAAGEQFRGLISKLCLQILNFAFEIVRGILKGSGHLLLRMLAGEKTKK
jgi:hypothetical protein